jgi:lysophospholipase L1-like esterase
MAAELGGDLDVYEAGMGGRTTVFDRLPVPLRSGRDLIVPTMETSAPLDLVIILLGTNDVSLPYLSVDDITRGAAELVSIVRSSWGYGPETGRAPIPLLVAPHVVGPLGPDDAILSPGAVERSRELGPAYGALSARLRCDFLDLAPVVEPSPRDPWHWEPEGHAAAAGAIAEVVRRILPRRD